MIIMVMITITIMIIPSNFVNCNADHVRHDSHRSDHKTTLRYPEAPNRVLRLLVEGFGLGVLGFGTSLRSRSLNVPQSSSRDQGTRNPWMLQETTKWTFSKQIYGFRGQVIPVIPLYLRWVWGFSMRAGTHIFARVLCTDDLLWGFEEYYYSSCKHRHYIKPGISFWN